jgi:hypothetical protein
MLHDILMARGAGEHHKALELAISAWALTKNPLVAEVVHTFSDELLLGAVHGQPQ